jgi:hypothetical protein
VLDGIAERAGGDVGADCFGLSDRWQQAPEMRDMIRALWRRVELEDR